MSVADQEQSCHTRYLSFCMAKVKRRSQVILFSSVNSLLFKVLKINHLMFFRVNYDLSRFRITRFFVIETITSAQNPKIKNLLLLQEKSKARREQGLFVVEGRRELEHCLEAGYTVKTIFVCPEIYNLMPELPDVSDDLILKRHCRMIISYCNPHFSSSSFFLISN